MMKKLYTLYGAESDAQIRQRVAEIEYAMFEETEKKIEQCEQAKEWVGQVQAGLENRKEV